MLGIHNIKVALMDSDFYALQAIYSYLAWDRRTRVVARATTAEELLMQLEGIAPVERPDVALFGIDWAHDVGTLRPAIEALRKQVGMVLCMSIRAERARIIVANEAGARGYLVKGDVRLCIAAAIVFAYYREFVVSETAARALDAPSTDVLNHAVVLPKQRRHPELTHRIAEALRLSVVEGMSAELAADEMGVSTYTVRSYVKDGYRILEAHDDANYPIDMSPQEKAFMRFTALEDPEG